MPHIDGLADARIIMASYPGTRVIIVSMHDVDILKHAAVEAGVAGWMHKGDVAKLLCTAVHSVLETRGGKAAAKRSSCRARP